MRVGSGPLQTMHCQGGAVHRPPRPCRRTHLALREAQWLGLPASFAPWVGPDRGQATHARHGLWSRSLRATSRWWFLAPRQVRGDAWGLEEEVFITVDGELQPNAAAFCAWVAEAYTITADRCVSFVLVHVQQGWLAGSDSLCVLPYVVEMCAVHGTSRVAWHRLAPHPTEVVLCGMCRARLRAVAWTSRRWLQRRTGSTLQIPW